MPVFCSSCKLVFAFSKRLSEDHLHRNHQLASLKIVRTHINLLLGIPDAGTKEFGLIRFTSSFFLENKYFRVIIS